MSKIDYQVELLERSAEVAELRRALDKATERVTRLSRSLSPSASLTDEECIQRAFLEAREALVRRAKG